MKTTKILIALSVMLFAFSNAFAQQHITNFGVVDTAKIYEQYFRNSSAVKNYDTKKEESKAEIAKRTEELRNLQAQLQEYKEMESDALVAKTEAEIAKKKDALLQYANSKNQELSRLKKTITDSDTFYKNLSKTIKKVAENEGLSMVLNLQDDSVVLWYNASVDITDKVIEALGK